MPVEELRKVRGGGIGMIFQEPMTALNPVHRIGRQLTEAVLLHQQITPRELWKRPAMLRRVQIPAAETRVNEHAHQLSGVCASES
jgi:peptide/nickel transport system ATP-binding protein